MTESETPALVFLGTSFTTRERLTPAIACSTFTRIPDDFPVRPLLGGREPPATRLFF